MIVPILQLITHKKRVDIYSQVELFCLFEVFKKFRPSTQKRSSAQKKTSTHGSRNEDKLITSFNLKWFWSIHGSSLPQINFTLVSRAQGQRRAYSAWNHRLFVIGRVTSAMMIGPRFFPFDLGRPIKSTESFSAAREFLHFTQ